MADPIKISGEELQLTAELQSQYQKVIFDFGNLYVEKIQIEDAVKVVTEKENKLQSRWVSLQNKENELIQQLMKKYGEGSIDLKSGLFIPSK
jgi:prefoldin subunit 5